MYKNLIIAIFSVIYISSCAEQKPTDLKMVTSLYRSTLDSTKAIPAQGQLEAYNARDIDNFVKWYSDSIKLIRFESGEVFLEGKEAFRERYANMFQEKTELYCHLENRIVIGNRVIDQEIVTGLREDTVHAVAIYTIEDGLIQEVSFISE